MRYRSAARRGKLPHCGSRPLLGCSEVELRLEVNPELGLDTEPGCPHRNAVSLVTERLPAMIWLTRLGGTSHLAGESRRGYAELGQLVFQDLPGMNDPF